MVIVCGLGKVPWQKNSIGHACHIVTPIDVDRVHLTRIVLNAPSDCVSVRGLSMPGDAFNPLVDVARSADEILEVVGIAG